MIDRIAASILDIDFQTKKQSCRPTRGWVDVIGKGLKILQKQLWKTRMK